MRRLLQGRYIFTLLAFLANMMNLLGRDSLRLAILPMKTELNLTESEVSHVLGGYNYGMVLTMLTGGPLSDILGGKWLLVVVTLLSGLCTALVPPLASLSLTWLVVSQVVYGLAGGLVVPGLAVMIARWGGSQSERGRLATIIYSGSQASAVFSSLLTGYISHHHHWSLVFYSLGSLPLLVWLLPWITLITDTPSTSPLTSQSERDLLAAEMTTSQVRPRLRDIPVRSLLSSGPVLAMVVANVGVIWANTHTALLLPQYLNDVLHLPLHHNSLVSTLPFIGCFILGLLAPPASSWLEAGGLSPTSARKVCSSVCLLGFALLTLPVPFIKTDTSLTIILTTGAYALTGFRYVGSWNNPLDLAPNFAGTLMGLSGLFCYLGAGLVPHTTVIMASMVSQENLWAGLFLLVAAGTILANTIFLLLGTAELQDWNTVETLGWGVNYYL